MFTTCAEGWPVEVGFADVLPSMVTDIDTLFEFTYSINNARNRVLRYNPNLQL